MSPEGKQVGRLLNLTERNLNLCNLLKLIYMYLHLYLHIYIFPDGLSKLYIATLKCQISIEVYLEVTKY